MVCAVSCFLIPTSEDIICYNAYHVCGKNCAIVSICSAAVKSMGGLRADHKSRIPCIILLILEGLIYWRDSQSLVGPMDVSYEYVQTLAFGSIGSAALIALLD